MPMGQKLAALRKQQGLTQEQLAEALNVSRQAVSKWESGAAYPETEKLIRLSEMYGCTLDHLVREDAQEEAQSKAEEEKKSEPLMQRIFRERKSKKVICGMPLLHIGMHARGIIAVGPEACGVLAIGLLARGVIPLGLVALGVFPFGVLAAGLMAYGCFALGIVAMGSICAGIISGGAISLGVMSFGAIAVGEFSVGALAIAKYAAIGDYAQALVALGQSEAQGELISYLGELTPQQGDIVRACLQENVPALLRWAQRIFQWFIP